MNLTIRQRLTYLAHLYKAVFKQHHMPLIPLLQKFIPVEGVVIDIGGHAGQFTKIFSSLAKKGRVFSFEPGTYAYSLLLQTKRFKNLSNVTLVKKGLSSSEKEVFFHIPLKASGSLGFGKSHIFLPGHIAAKEEIMEEKISVISLDKFIKEVPLGRVDFIKMDVEGHEWEVLKGAEDTVNIYRPFMMIEINSAHLARAGAHKNALFEFLENKGYRSGKIDQSTGTLNWTHTRENGDYIFSCPGR